MVPVTAFFAGLFGFIFIALSVHVIRGRYRNQVAIGDGGHHDMKYRIRAHGNFAEYVPFALILMAACELTGTGKLVLTFLGLALVVGRLSHAYSLLVIEPKNAAKFTFRMIGMSVTFFVLVVLSLLAIF